eukprot:scaffold25212_cov34-Phaeocystis_antarctica.AAC.6
MPGYGLRRAPLPLFRLSTLEDRLGGGSVARVTGGRWLGMEWEVGVKRKVGDRVSRVEYTTGCVRAEHT